jgi:hypothetical protein
VLLEMQLHVTNLDLFSDVEALYRRTTSLKERFPAVQVVGGGLGKSPKAMQRK